MKKEMEKKIHRAIIAHSKEEALSKFLLEYEFSESNGFIYIGEYVQPDYFHSFESFLYGYVFKPKDPKNIGKMVSQFSSARVVDEDYIQLNTAIVGKGLPIAYCCVLPPQKNEKQDGNDDCATKLKEYNFFGIANVKHDWGKIKHEQYIAKTLLE